MRPSLLRSNLLRDRIQRTQRNRRQLHHLLRVLLRTRPPVRKSYLHSRRHVTFCNSPISFTKICQNTPLVGAGCACHSTAQSSEILPEIPAPWAAIFPLTSPLVGLVIVAPEPTVCAGFLTVGCPEAWEGRGARRLNVQPYQGSAENGWAPRGARGPTGVPRDTADRGAGRSAARGRTDRFAPAPGAGLRLSPDRPPGTRTPAQTASAVGHRDGSVASPSGLCSGVSSTAGTGSGTAAGRHTAR